ncbi:hypothetical protein HDV01_001303 [Terramyces sp. JEL0728]|nr:hypothetical protein HDV01_001303 [Terramyces sp. JEL0728]
MSTPFLEFNWQSSDCVGAPSSIFAYNDYQNSTILSIIENDVGYNVCSTEKAGVPPDSCCHSAADKSMTLTYQSMAGTFLYQGDAYDDLATQDILPKSIANQFYCAVNALDIGYAEYNTGFYLDSNTCFQGFIKCFQNSLLIYDGDGCTSAPIEEFTLATESNYTSAILGNFTGKMTGFTHGQFSYIWVSNFPTNMVYPLNKDPLEILGTICLAICGILPLGSMVFKGHQLSRRWQIRDFLMLLVNAIFFLYSILSFYSEYYVASPDDSISKLSFLTTVPIYTQDISFYCVYLMDVFIIFDLCIQGNLMHKTLSYIGITFLHIALDGSDYMYYWVIYGLYIGDASLYEIQSRWVDFANNFRVLVWFLVGVFTTLAVTVKIIHVDKRFLKAGLRGKLFVFFQNPQISLPLLCGTLNLAFYYVILNIGKNTFVAGNDRALAGLGNCIDLFYVLHFIIQQYSFYSFKGILINALKYKADIATGKPSEKSAEPLKMLVAHSKSKTDDGKTVDEKQTVRI